MRSAGGACLFDLLGKRMKTFGIALVKIRIGERGFGLGDGRVNRVNLSGQPVEIALVLVAELFRRGGR